MNVCMIYDTACLFDLIHLRQYCAQFIDNHAEEIIHSNEFLSLSPVREMIILTMRSCMCVCSSSFFRKVLPRLSHAIHSIVSKWKSSML